MDGTMARKKQYRIRNWPEYNKALVNRGSLTIWFDEESIAEWHNTQQSGQRGRPQDYSDTAIICALTLRNIFRLPLRATQGLVASLIDLLQLPITAPDYTTLCRRQSSLILPQYKSKHNKPLHLVVDGSGFKIFGEGEWKMRQHGKEKRRVWRKLHIAVDEASQDIVMAVISDSKVHDCEVLDLLLPSRQDVTVSQVTGDGAYDAHNCYDAAIKIGAKPCFPPRVNAARNKPIDEARRLRNRVVGSVRRKGLKNWKRNNNYHQRSLAETAFSRLKKIFGSHAASRVFENQVIELGLRCKILNKINQLGMPDSVMV
jgi:IS5 family transposase